MIASPETMILIGAVLLFISIWAGQRAYKYGIPSLILFLIVGMVSGTEGIGKINFDNPQAVQFVGIIALNFILFSGGLDTRWKSIRPVLWQGITLSTLGVIITAFSVGLFIHWITDFTLYEGLLLGSIVSSTDAAAVFSILRSRNLSLKHNLRPTLEFESGSNDPMAYLLTILFLSLVVDPGAGIGHAIGNFFIQITVGVGAGFLFGMGMTYTVNHLKLGYRGLYPVLVIAMMYITFAATDKVGGNGFLAVYLAALWLGNHKLPHQPGILSFFDGFAWLMQIILFLVLGLQVYPSHILPFIGIGLLISAFMILIARPLSIFISLIGFKKVTTRSKLFISWVGLRGAVPIVFATYPLIAGIEKAGVIFNIVFFISLTSVLIQGTTLPIFARWLKVSAPEEKPLGKTPDLEIDDISNLIEVTIPEDNAWIGIRVAETPFPDGARITLIKRGDEALVVTGSTELAAMDRLIIACRSRNDADAVHNLFG